MAPVIHLGLTTYVIAQIQNDSKMFITLTTSSYTKNSNHHFKNFSG